MEFHPFGFPRHVCRAKVSPLPVLSESRLFFKLPSFLPFCLLDFLSVISVPQRQTLFFLIHLTPSPMSFTQLLPFFRVTIMHVADDPTHSSANTLDNQTPEPSGDRSQYPRDTPQVPAKRPGNEL